MSTPPLLTAILPQGVSILDGSQSSHRDVAANEKFSDVISDQTQNTDLETNITPTDPVLSLNTKQVSEFLAPEATYAEVSNVPRLKRAGLPAHGESESLRSAQGLSVQTSLSLDATTAQQDTALTKAQISTTDDNSTAVTSASDQRTLTNNKSIQVLSKDTTQNINVHKLISNNTPTNSLDAQANQFQADSRHNPKAALTPQSNLGGLPNTLPPLSKGAATTPLKTQAASLTLHNSGTLTPSVLGTKATSTAINYETDQHILPAQVDVATASSNILLEAPPPLSPNVLTYALEDAITFSPGDTQQPVVLSSAQNAGALPQVFKSFATPIAPQPAQTLAKPAEIPAIVSETLTAATPEDNRVVVQLDPPELGRITIDFKFDGQALQAIAITSETPEALRQLRHMHFELIQALEDNGLSNGDLSFNQEKGSEHQARQFDQQHKAKTTIAAQPSQWSPKNQRTTNTDAGLDIKV